jgi:hypothetical protein
MSTLKLMRLVGAVTLLAAAPVVGAIAVYAQTMPQASPPVGQSVPAPKMAPGASSSDEGTAAKPDTEAPATKPASPTTGASPEKPSTDLRATGPTPLPGQLVMTSDGQRAGEVTGIKSAPDGKVEEIHIKTGGLLGFGGRTVAIPAGSFAVSGQNVQLSLSSTDVGKLPAVQPVQG